MPFQRTNWFMVGGAVLVLAMLAPCAVAQTYFMYPGQGTSVSLEIFKPHFDDDDYNFLTSLFFLSGQIRTTDRLFVRAEIPISNADISYDWWWYGDYDVTETMIGNPYLGLEYRMPVPNDNHVLTARFGLRLPIASDDKFGAFRVGNRAAYDRFEAFLPDYFALNSGIGFTATTASGLKFSTDFGALLIAPTDDGDSEVFADYDFALWIPIDNFNLGFGTNGRVLLSEGDLNFGERTINHMCVAGNFDFGKFRPGFHFRAPVDEYLSDVVSFVYGLNFTYQIK